MSDLASHNKPIQVDAPKPIAGAPTTPPPVTYSYNPKKKKNPAPTAGTEKKE